MIFLYIIVIKWSAGNIMFSLFCSVTFSFSYFSMKLIWIPSTWLISTYLLYTFVLVIPVPIHFTKDVSVFCTAWFIYGVREPYLFHPCKQLPYQPFFLQHAEKLHQGPVQQHHLDLQISTTTAAADWQLGDRKQLTNGCSSAATEKQSCTSAFTDHLCIQGQHHNAMVFWLSQSTVCLIPSIQHLLPQFSILKASNFHVSSSKAFGAHSLQSHWASQGDDNTEGCHGLNICFVTSTQPIKTVWLLQVHFGWQLLTVGCSGFPVPRDTCLTR